jgi:formate hydrogenlyase subunit 4
MPDIIAGEIIVIFIIVNVENVIVQRRTKYEYTASNLAFLKVIRLFIKFIRLVLLNVLLLIFSNIKNIVTCLTTIND